MRRQDKSEAHEAPQQAKLQERNLQGHKLERQGLMEARRQGKLETQQEARLRQTQAPPCSNKCKAQGD